MIILEKPLFIDEKKLNDTLAKFLESYLPEKLDTFLQHMIPVSFLSIEQMTEQNRQHRQKDYLTDVLSWNFLEDGMPLLPNEAMGEILISLDKAQEQALQLNTKYEQRVIFLIVHGFLHVMGLDHQTEKEALEMEAFEAILMKNLETWLAKAKKCSTLVEISGFSAVGQRARFGTERPQVRIL